MLSETCPDCNGDAVALNIPNGCWGFCEPCGVKWWKGSTHIATALVETREDLEANKEKLASVRITGIA